MGGHFSHKTPSKKKLSQVVKKNTSKYSCKKLSSLLTKAQFRPEVATELETNHNHYTIPELAAQISLVRTGARQQSNLFAN